MYLYVGNATRQNYNFTYRTAEMTVGNGFRSQIIPPGSQIKIAYDFTREEIDAVIKSKTKYGMIAEDQIDRLAGGYLGICYQIDKPIARGRLNYLFSHNVDALVVQGQEIRQHTAVAQSQILEHHLTESGRPERVAELDITIQQEDHDSSDPSPQFSEGLKIEPEQSRGGKHNRRR